MGSLFFVDNKDDFYENFQHGISISKAFTNPKWIAIATPSENYISQITAIWQPFLCKHLTEGNISNFNIHFSEGHSDRFVITLRTNQLCYQEKIKSDILKNAELININGSGLTSPGLGWYAINDSKTIFLNDFYISDYSYQLGYLALQQFESLLHISSSLYVKFLSSIAGEEDLLQEKSIEQIFPKQIVLACAVFKSKTEVLAFYKYRFNRIMGFFTYVKKTDLDKFVLLMETNCHAHKEMFAPFIDVLFDNVSNHAGFEEDWLNEWMNSCLKLSHTMETTKNDSLFRVYDADPYPSRWIFMDVLFYAIHNQYHIDMETELNMYYMIIDILSEKKND